MEEITLEIISTLLHSPKLNNFMPKDFDYEAEAEHLYSLIQKCPDIAEYRFEEFICAGGSGMVFKVQRAPKDGPFAAMKIIRKRVFENREDSPFSSEELDALKELSHPNIIRLFETIKFKDTVVAVCTAYIENAQGIDHYIQDTLDTPPSPNKYKDALSQVSVERLESTCETVALWVFEIAKAIEHMHSRGYYHLDIKPANILMQGSGNNVHPILTDMGSCVNINRINNNRVHFTWAYAHPDLTDIHKGDPGSIERGAMRASAQISNTSKLPIYDLYAFGKTIQQILAVIDNHFGEVCYSCYTFRYLHIISALLLDGQNNNQGNKCTENIYQRNGVKFVSSRPMHLSERILSAKRILSSSELITRLNRLRKDYSIIELAPEFNPRCPNVINNTIGEPVPFTKRVAAVFNHSMMKRLYNEAQLGLMTEIYPGASHNRWSHSLGVFSLLVKYYIALLSDPENPFLKITIDSDDINHGLLAAILHDIGQTSMCHDLEAANGAIFNHLESIKELINNTAQSTDGSLMKTIREYWGKDINLQRIIGILTHKPIDLIDNVVADCIDGALDVDKLDYIKRDSYYCGVSYGQGIDYSRIMNSLTIAEKDETLKLAYYAKGRTAIASMLIARYQLYGSVYWHHTYRCLHSMLYYATQSAFGSDESIHIKVYKNRSINGADIKKLYNYRVLCKLSWEECWSKIGYNYSTINSRYKVKDRMFTDDYCLDFIYAFTDDKCRELLEKLRRRIVYKRIYSKNLKDVDLVHLSMKCRDRIGVSKQIQDKLFDAIVESRTQDARESAAERSIDREVLSLKNKLSESIAILVDFPQKITVPTESWPIEIGDSARKLQNYNTENMKEVVVASNDLLTEVAFIRIYAEPSFYSLITRYLSARVISGCIKTVIGV